MFNVGTCVVLWETVIDAVDSSAVAADVRDELLCSADCAPFQEALAKGWAWPLKIVPLTMVLITM